MPDDELTYIIGADEALIGEVFGFDVETRAVYDYDLLIQHFMDDGMTEEEAVEWFEFNVLGAWVGSKTPLFIRRY